MFSFIFTRENALLSIPTNLLATALLLSAANASAADCTYLTYDQFKASYPGQTQCTCSWTGGGTIWGTFLYTSDSPICQAAVHYGLRNWGETATVNVYPADSNDSFFGMTRYGVTTYPYSSSWQSFSFIPNQSNLSGKLASQESALANDINTFGSTPTVTFFAGGDPQFMYDSGLGTKEKADNAARAGLAMTQAAKMANNCTQYGKKCSPAFVISGDLMMDWNHAYLGESQASYENVIQRIGSASPNTVVLDGLGNHDSAYGGPTPFFNNPGYGYTGASSKGTAWNVHDTAATHSCWNDGLYPYSGGFVSATAWYCGYSNINYYTVKINNYYNSGQQAYIIQLHSLGDYYADQYAINYLATVAATLDPAIPVVIVSHYLPLDNPNLADPPLPTTTTIQAQLSRINSITQNMNIASWVVGHKHLDPAGGTNWNMSNSYLKNKYGYNIPIFNASALLSGAFISVTIGGNKVRANRFDYANASIQAASGDIAYKP